MCQVSRNHGSILGDNTDVSESSSGSKTSKVRVERGWSVQALVEGSAVLANQRFAHDIVKHGVPFVTGRCATAVLGF